MTRARALVGAVPQRVWTAVAGLALLASLAVAAVIGAGLSVWRNAVGTTAQPPQATIEPPNSGLVVLPGGKTTHVVPTPRQPAPTGGPVTPVTVPVALSGQPGSPVTGTPVPFVPHVPAAHGDNGGFGARVGELGGGESESRTSGAAHTAHLRHEARVHERAEAARHHAKHANHATHGKHGKHAGRGGKHAASKHHGTRQHHDD